MKHLAGVNLFHSLDINLDDYRKRALVGLLNLDDLQESILSQKEFMVVV